jgi:CRISPR-associated protein Csm4
MRAKAIKLAFAGPVHFGGGRLSDGSPVCDVATLFSALYIEALHDGGADDLLCAARSGDLGLSDSFPYQGARLYLPKPNISFAGVEAARRADSRARKAAKKLKYIPLESMGDYVRGSLDPIAEIERFSIGESFLRTKVNLEHRDKPDAEPYFVGGFSFAPGCGIYFILEGSYDIVPLLEQLGYSGIGGKRTSGYGGFTFSIEDIEIPEPQVRKARMLLSSAAPRKDELDENLLAGARYRLVRKGGFVQSVSHAPTPRRKRDFWTFCPGSVFSTTFSGEVFDVNDTPESHPVYRYARAMWMEV